MLKLTMLRHLQCATHHMQSPTFTVPCLKKQRPAVKIILQMVHDVQGFIFSDMQEEGFFL